MKFYRADLDRLKSPRLEIDEEIIIDQDLLKGFSLCTALREIFAVGHGYYDEHTSKLITDLTIEGIMTVPCAITLEPFDIEFSIPIGDVFSFEKLEDDEVGIEIEGEELDLDPYIVDSILAAVPLKAIHPDLKEYPEGDGWQVMTEEDYTKEKSQEIDPRLAKLKDFKFD
ncbi:DUF177 domain-containing protein [Erysipelothrix piscisicarius]|uniref:DUF177 domain-containing protein n=1 Tax=Erysipelothrix piscisicarius TaxID=2485784 RepID=A0A3Q8S326_9FIRM|nr:DUF177 domain-containing protein [Erysipelothrix piscisicarius]AZK44542.1 DUF177 domain-containing protein [Erysipelothrix piscisicarius]